jgi:acyl carrier protein
VMEVLKLKDIASDQPFQDYGLDSISAMVLATRLEKKLKRQVQPQWLIDFSTVESLSEYLTAQDSEDSLE